MPTRTTRPAQGRLTLKVVASAMASTVPGKAQGSASIASRSRRPLTRQRTTRCATAIAIPTAMTVAAPAMNSELTIGLRVRASEKS